MTNELLILSVKQLVKDLLQHPVESKASVRDVVFHCFSSHLVIDCETEINDSDVG